MTISFSATTLVEIDQQTWQLAQHPDPMDQQDWVLTSPLWMHTGGYVREVELGNGLVLRIDNYCLRDRCLFSFFDDETWLGFHFHLSGQHQDPFTEVNNLEYALYGVGLRPKSQMLGPNRYPVVEVTIWMSSQALVSFMGQDGQLPAELTHLVRPGDQLFYSRVGKVSEAMQRVLWQIMGCPFQGICKRMFLESKALEAAALVLVEESELQQQKSLGNARKPSPDYHLTNLKPDDIDRLYQAQQILVNHLENPPTLMDLAKQVGLNSRALKEGFRQVFGQPPFCFLSNYRLEQARSLLETEEAKVAEVAAAVGFADRSHFAQRFRAKFGLSPKHYQLQQKKYR